MINLSHKQQIHQIYTDLLFIFQLMHQSIKEVLSNNQYMHFKSAQYNLLKY